VGAFQEAELFKILSCLGLLEHWFHASNAGFLERSSGNVDSNTFTLPNKLALFVVVLPQLRS
jgi:hypothetical protein